MSEESIIEIKRRLDAVEKLSQASHDTLIRMEAKLESFKPAGCGDVCKMQTDRLHILEKRLSIMEKVAYTGMGALAFAQWFFR